MNKRTTAILIKLIPPVAALVTFFLVFRPLDSAAARKVTDVSVLLAFFGFIFYLIWHKMGREDKVIRVLNILDLLSTASIIVLYILVFISLGM